MRGSSLRQSLASIILVFEAVVMFFAALTIFGLKALPAGLALGGGAAVCVLLMATAGIVMRFNRGYILGWVLQAVIVAACFLVPMLAIVAVIFIGLWVYAMIKGARVDREKAAWLAAQAEEAPPAA
ncbi:DUF4233 domain-containing protein [Herbiconiux sp.]|uniref:DUF4233 domain-containing protein n=1 Tax=Herbiconiux sp. TaxID=1871186 RepID=UPI0025B8D439|nr:DUF4233 domain-containing protein [Herbiconiux sp.]